MSADPQMVQQLRKLIKESGQSLTLTKLNEHHWQIKGGLHLVNWYPASRAGTMYLNGATSGKQRVAAADVLAAATGGSNKLVGPANGKKRPDLGGARRAMYRQNPHCFWCKCRVWEKELCDPQIKATVDHKIPRSKGGSDRRDNLVLACHRCNKKRKNELGAPA